MSTKTKLRVVQVIYWAIPIALGVVMAIATDWHTFLFFLAGEVIGVLLTFFKFAIDLYKKKVEE